MRLFACMLGATLAALGLVGLLYGLSSGVWIAEGLLSLLVGVLVFYVGAAGWSPADIRYTIGGVGILYLLSGGVPIAASFAFARTVEISNMVHMAVGAALVLGTWALSRGTRPLESTGGECTKYEPP